MFQITKYKDPREFIIFCSIAGFISAWAISGMLVTLDYISGTPVGSFFAVIGFSLGYYDISTAQVVGFMLHLLTGTTAGNIFGQVAAFWPLISPIKSSQGAINGMIVGIALWAVLFVPLATFGIQGRIDSLRDFSPTQDVFMVVSHFDGLYYIIIGGSLAFHIVYGAFMGFLAGRMHELRRARDRQVIQ